MTERKGMFVTVFWDLEGGGVYDGTCEPPDSYMFVPEYVKHDKVADYLTDKTGFFVFSWKEVRH